MKWISETIKEKFASRLIRSDIKSIETFYAICSLFSLGPFYNFETRKEKWCHFGKFYTIILLGYYVYCAYQTTVINIQQTEEAKYILLSVAEFLNYVFVFATIISSIVIYCFLQKKSYVTMLRLLHKLDRKIHPFNNQRDYYYLTMFCTSILFINPIVWEYLVDYYTGNSRPLFVLICDSTTIPHYHLMLNLVSTFANIIKYRMEYINGLFNQIEDGFYSKSSNRMLLKHIFDLYKDVNKIVMLFNEVFSWPLALYFPIFILDIVYTLNNIFKGTPWDLLGFCIHDMVRIESTRNPIPKRHEKRAPPDEFRWHKALCA